MKESEELSNVLKYFRETEQLHKFAIGRIGELEQLQNDLLHKIEINCANVAERNKVATALRKCRVERRKYKDKVELMNGLIEFIDNNRPAIKKLEKILGSMRQVEENQDKRTYKPRVMTSEEWEA